MVTDTLPNVQMHFKTSTVKTMGNTYGIDRAITLGKWPEIDAKMLKINI